MSFSGEVKRELCKITPQKHCCALAELCGVLLFATSFDQSGAKIHTSVNPLCGHIKALAAAVLGRGMEVACAQAKNRRSVISIATEDAADIARLMGLDGESAALHLNGWIIAEDCCRAAFLRGAFLTGGYIADPETDYYLELVTPRNAVSREVFALLSELGLSPKQTLRKGKRVIYFKESERIEEYLTLAGAHRAVLRIMETKVVKDVRNRINRKVNCETSNLSRSASSAAAQLAAIELVDRHMGLASLPRALQAAAALRTSYPEEPLSELAARANPPISKSGLNHRLCRIVKLAKGIEERGAGI